MRKALIKLLVLVLGFMGLWQMVVWGTGVPKYILPSPWLVFCALKSSWALLVHHAGVTLAEILLGLALGVAMGVMTALALQRFIWLRAWMMPVLIVSQAVPVFALAPVLMLWLGYGMAAKVAMSMVIIYFPVTIATYDGLRHTPKAWLELAQVMNARRWQTLYRIRIPAALPAFASGLRVAVSVAPIGAVIGEWIGGSQGLGYLMLHANARLQIDLMFAALLILSMITLTLYFSVDFLLRKFIHWQH